jgi:hypothetical protein
MGLLLVQGKCARGKKIGKMYQGKETRENEQGKEIWVKKISNKYH